MPVYAEYLRKIPANPLRASVTSDKLTPKEITQFRSALGQMAWLATNLRPDLAAECSMLLSTSLEAEHQCLAEGVSAEDAHKVLHTKEAEPQAQHGAEQLSWLKKCLIALEARTCENLVY